MNVNIMQISERGMKLHFSNEDWVLDTCAEAIDGQVKKCSIEIDLDRYNKRIEARVQYTLTGIVLCSRCAQEIQTEYSAAESLLFDPAMDTHEEEIELQGEDLDIGWYEDGKLDIPTVICEAIVLSFPQRIHCKMDIVKIPASGDCYTPPEKEERTLENMFADLLKKQ